ncbi:MAG TPA: outer membrane beta-barrel protein [Vicinamibacterales bacterium]|nr:outer membrane beta-barrel protein [Vicinamibacterales bacterium]
MNRPLSHSLAAVVAWASIAGAGVCAAQAPEPPMPPGTVVLGPVQITPSVVLTDMGVDQNVFNDPVDPKSDFTFTLTPRAEVRFRMRRLRLTYLSTTEYVYFETFKSEGGLNTSSSARLELDLGRLKPYGSVQGLNSQSRPNTEVDARARHHDLTYGAGVSFKIASRTSVVVNGTTGTVAYDEDEPTFRGVDLADSFNGRRRGVDTGIALELTPITTLNVTLGRDEQRFTLSPDRDANSWRVSATASFNPSGVLTGSASLGYRDFQPLSSTIEPYAGLVSSASIGVTIYSRHQVSAQFNRDVQYSYDRESVYYVNTGGTVTWTWLFAGPLDVRGTAGRVRMAYQDDADGVDRTTTYGGGIGYRLPHQARLGLNVLWTRRDSSTDPLRGFRNHRIFAGLSWGTT